MPAKARAKRRESWLSSSAVVADNVAAVPMPMPTPAPTPRRTLGWPHRFALARLVRALVVPLGIALPPLFWVVSATARASRTPLGRDQGIFQYVAWALRQGQIDYRDIRDVNGPLTHLVHVAFLALGGADDQRFHVLDFAVTGASFALVGACLPGLASRRARAPERLERVAWALAAWVVLSGQYLLYGYWDLAQRESFFDWFMLSSVALQLAMQAPRRARDGVATPRTRGLALAGALSVVPWFGKPTFALFTMAQLLTLLVDGATRANRRLALRAFALGGALGAACVFALLCVYGDPVAFVRVQLADVPSFYHFIWPRAPADIFSNAWCATQAIFALSGAVVLLSLIVIGEMPARALAVALLPVCALASVVVQAKGFPYHFHPVTAGVHLQWLVFAAWLTERTRVAQRRWALLRLAPIAAGLVVALRVATALEDSPHVRAAWLLWGATTPDQRSTREYFARFPETDFFPFEMRQAAAYLRGHTAKSDRVQVYGMDPYILFLAERLSATPYIYAYDLDVDAALSGGTGAVPNDTQSEHIRHIGAAHETDLRARLTAAPPAAFVFFDGSPLISEFDAWDDFEAHCESTAAWVHAHYREAARFGHDHIWLRNDLVPPEATPSGSTGSDDEAPSPEGPSQP